MTYEISLLKGVNMPYQLKKPCSFPGCPELVEPDSSYCEMHKTKTNANRNKLYDEKERDPKFSMFYNSSVWRKLRNLKLSRDPLCEYCMEREQIKIASEVDHVIPLKVVWSKRLDINNLKSSCHRCHMKKTQEDRREYG